jgi:hypothetical protein
MMMMRFTFLVSLYLSLIPTASATVYNFLDVGGIPDDESPEACQFNKDLLSRVLQNYASNNTLLIPSNTTFHLFHGVYGKHVNNTIIQIDGTLRFERFDYSFDKDLHGPPPCFMIDSSQNVTLTSSGRGLIDGRGPQYWGVPMIGYLQLKENRPRLIRFNLTTDLLIENIIFQDSPYHTLYLEAVNRVEIRNISIVARRTERDGHSWIDLTAFNTDGIDVSGHNVHIHDVDIWVQDDCIAVKDNKFLDFHSSNMTFERVNASGLGFVVGSIGGSTVRNITFRDSYLHRPVKGIYLKFHTPNHFWTDKNLTGLIEDVRFENIIMEEPSQWPIWIGPAQQSDNRNPCHPNPCSLCWPMTPRSRCLVVKEAKFRNIELVNIHINNPKMSPGVILGTDDDAIESVVFDHVRVTKGKPVPYANEDLFVTFPGLLQPIHDPYVLGVSEEDWTGDFFGSSYMLPAGEFDESQGESADQETTLALFETGSLFVAFVVAIFWTLLMLYRMRAQILARQATGNDHMKEPLLSAKSQPSSLWSLSSSRELWRVVFGLLACTVLSVLVRLSFVSSAMSAAMQMPIPIPGWHRTSRYYACKGVTNGIAKGNTWPIPYCFNDETSSWFQSMSSQVTAPLVSAPLLSICLCCACCIALLLARRWKVTASRN